MAACFQGNYEGAKELLELGADPNVESHDGYTAWTFATKYNHPRILDMLENPKNHNVKANVPPLTKRPVMPSAGPSQPPPNNPPPTSTTTNNHPQQGVQPPHLPKLPGLSSQVPMPPTGTFASSRTRNPSPPVESDGSLPDLPDPPHLDDEPLVRLAHIENQGPAYRN